MCGWQLESVQEPSQPSELHIQTACCGLLSMKSYEINRSVGCLSNKQPNISPNRFVLPVSAAKQLGQANLLNGLVQTCAPIRRGTASVDVRPVPQVHVRPLATQATQHAGQEPCSC